MTLSCLVIGYGSVGARHAAVLQRLGAEVAVVSRRGEGPAGARRFRSLGEAQAAGAADYTIIAVETALHHETLDALACSGYAGRVLVEKPLFAMPAPLPSHRFRRAGVGYNLRFHSVIGALAKAIGGRPALMADFHVGQFLGAWRPGRDAARTYSASQAGGGGVLRDLSHELDLLTWLFGPWRRVAALGGRLGQVTVDADDGWGILLEAERCAAATLHMNALDRTGRRTITVQLADETLHADLVAGTLESKSGRETFSAERDESYAAMHRALLEDGGRVCTLEEGIRTVELVDAIERAAREGRWIVREAP